MAERMTATEEVKAGIKWTREHPVTWEILRDMVARDAQNQTRELRLSAYVEQLRARGFSFRNEAAPYVVRRLARETGARMAMNSSKIDLLMEDDEALERLNYETV